MQHVAALALSALQKVLARPDQFAAALSEGIGEGTCNTNICSNRYPMPSANTPPMICWHLSSHLGVVRPVAVAISAPHKSTSITDLLATHVHLAASRVVIDSILLREQAS